MKDGNEWKEWKDGKWREKIKGEKEGSGDSMHHRTATRAQVRDRRVTCLLHEGEAYISGRGKSLSNAMRRRQQTQRDIKLGERTHEVYGVCDEREDLSLDTDECAGAGSCGACS
ncbi:hypothetical protein C8R45DRAFT_921804 [Mycena sanguinolenta]|nr:hypothetical protein C8R45DRAFT_921804 [Mycena sanguinolenta]